MSRIPIIAVVDDSFAIRDALFDLISSLGFLPQLYASAEEFLCDPDRGDVDVMIVDFKMQGMTGLDLQLRLNAEDACPPFILMTSYHEDRLRQAVLAGGAIAFLQKPFDANVLIAYLNDALTAR